MKAATKNRQPATFSLLLLVLLTGIFAMAGCRQPARPTGEALPRSYQLRIDTIHIASAAMDTAPAAIIILPSAYFRDRLRPFPVLYLLHGYSGNYANWLEKVPSLPRMADEHELIIVTPDGGYAGWYINSPIDSGSRYATYIGEEVPAAIDQRYRTRRSPEGRAITGLSMGGHGALHLTLKYPATFGAAGSMSGGVDLRPFPDNWELPAILGDQAAYPQHWERFSVLPNSTAFKDNRPALIIDCGTEDFFFQVNERLHQTLLREGIPHDYISRPGSHNWDYWANAVAYQLLFFDRFFHNGNQQ